MKKNNLKNFIIAIALLVAFLVWTVIVMKVDVKAIIPIGSVGLSAMNFGFRELVGFNETLYKITDVLGLVPIAFALGFAVLGFIQLVKRKSLLKVDADILVLGCFYIAVMILYFFFEKVIINYRPVRIDGKDEASYPSTTTMLVLFIIPTAIMQLRNRIDERKDVLRNVITVGLCAFTAFMVIGRLISGVHWLSDIIGGILLSAGLVVLYVAIVKAIKGRAESVECTKSDDKTV